MNAILSSIFFGVWAIERDRAMVFLPDVKRLLEGTCMPLSEEALRVYRAEHMPQYHLGDGEQVSGQQPQEDDFVMVLPLRGAILKNDVYCGPIGCETRAMWLRKAEADPRCLGVVLDADTPGGEGAGMRVLVQQLKRMTKPVHTYVNNGLLCSAGMGIGAATRGITLSGKSDVIGSIGTYMTIADMAAHFREHLKLPIHTVYATESTEKNRPFKEALQADPNNPDDPHYKLLREQVIDPFNEEFIAHVKASRPQVKDADGVFNGKVFFGDDAIRLGLADGYGTLQDCIDAVRRQAGVSGNRSTGRRASSTHNTETNPATDTNTNMSKMSKMVVALATALGFDAKEEVTAENFAEINEALKKQGVTAGAFVSTAEVERLANAAQQVAAAKSAQDSVESQLAKAETAKTTAEGLLATANTDKATAEGKATEATNALAAVETKLKTAATAAKLEVKEGDQLADVVATALTTATARVAELESQVATLKNEDAPDSRPEGVVNKQGDTTDPTKDDALSKMDHMVKVDDED